MNMNTQDRRLTRNIALRQKIDRLQAIHHALEQQALAMAREGSSLTLPDAAEHALALDRLLKRQTASVKDIQSELIPSTIAIKPSLPLLSDEELLALMQDNP